MTRQTASTEIGQEAPGRLELVRTLLNTWEIPSETREPIDLLPGLASDEGAWKGAFPGIRRPRGPELKELISFRNGLRTAVEGRQMDVRWFNGWLRKLDVAPALREGDVPKVELVTPPRSGVAGIVAAAVAEALSAGIWSRLKACPDCRWVSYDWTKNASKVWCRMYAGSPNRRACGSIAKVRRYRNRMSEVDRRLEIVHEPP